jgi:hypothetical protein
MTRPQSRYPMDSGLNVFGDQGAPQAGAAPGLPLPPPGSPREVHVAMLAYLGIPFTLCLLPLICGLVSRRQPSPGQPPGGRSFARVHTAQALALSLAALLYTLCGLIVGGVLVLDSPQVAVVIAVPLLALLWLSVLAVAVRSAIAASRGESRPVSRWLRLSPEPPVSR